MTDPLVLEIPDLSGEGWHLRAWRPDDAASLSRAWHDPAIIAGSTPPADRGVDAARRWIEGCDERRLAGVAFDLVIAGDDDEVLGEVGLSRMDAGRRAALIGWWIAAEHRGRGLATAAVGSFTAWLVGTGELRDVLAEIDGANAGSVAVARSAGFQMVRDATVAAPGVWRRSMG